MALQHFGCPHRELDGAPTLSNGALQKQRIEKGCQREKEDGRWKEREGGREGEGRVGWREEGERWGHKGEGGKGGGGGQKEDAGEKRVGRTRGGWQIPRPSYRDQEQHCTESSQRKRKVSGLGARKRVQGLGLPPCKVLTLVQSPALHCPLGIAR